MAAIITNIAQAGSAIEMPLVNTLQTANACGSPPLSKLPPEIRCMVYRTALVYPSELKVSKDTIRECTALLKVCLQIRYEASGIFYQENKFLISIDATGDNVGLDWLSIIGEEHTKLIAEIMFPFQNSKVSKEMVDSFNTAHYGGNSHEARKISNALYDSGVPTAIHCAEKVLSLAIPTTSIVYPPRQYNMHGADFGQTAGEQCHYISIYRMVANFYLRVHGEETLPSGSKFFATKRYE